jgi:F-type H+-transporting ATPase subunit b
MTLIHQLGINSTAFIQFGIFAIAFFSLTFIAFKPYADALEKRGEKTTGGEEVAVEMKMAATDLRSQYESKARTISAEIKSIFDKHREQAMAEYSNIIAKARGESQVLVDDTRKKVAVQIAEAAKQLKDEVPAVSSAITSKLVK